MWATMRQAFCVFLAMGWVSAATAQTTEQDLALAYGDTSNISIATGTYQPISKAPAVASVITAEDIKAMGATDLDQALESVPGLHVSMVHVAMNPIYEFRGIVTKYNPQVLMMVNGIPITNVFWGDRSQIWGGMPLEDVKRIEVIRGPGSALYGADAFAGVINVVTKTAGDVHGMEYGARVGSFNTRDAWMQYGGRLGTLDSAFYLRAGNTDGGKGLLAKDALANSGSLSTERKAIDAHADLSRDAWRFRATYQQRKVGVGAGVAGSLDPNSRANATRLYLDLDYDKANWAPNWDVSGTAGYYNVKEYGDPAYMLFPPGTNIGTGPFPNGMIGNPGHAEQHTHADVSATYTGFEQHRVRIGTGYRVDDLYSVTETKNYDATFTPLPAIVVATNNPGLVYMLPHKRNVSYAYAQDEWNFAQDWTLTAGVRHDKYSDFGGTTNPRLALVWDAAYNVVVKAMHGTAFRAPSFSELYSINNPVTVGNPTLKPEKLTSDELAFSWQPRETLHTSLNFFHYRMSDIILPVGAVYQNSGGQTGKGLELEATLDATSSLRLTGNFSLQHSIDTATGKDAGLAPHRRLYGRADWRFAPLWQLGVTANRVMERMREPADARPPVPDYTTVDLTLHREKIAKGWEASAMVTNLFNSNALEPTFLSSGITSDLPLPGRAAYLQVTYGM